MKTKLLFLTLLLLAFGGSLFAQNSASGNISATSTNCTSVVSSCVWESPLPPNAGTTTVNLAGTFSATLLVEESNNGGQTWSTAATLSSAGTTTYSTNGFTDIRVRCSAYTSGTAAVTISTGLQQVQSVVAGGGAFAGGLGASFQDATEIATPANPAAGNDRLSVNSTTHILTCQTSAGASCMPTGGSPAFSSVTAGTNAAALVMGTGGSLGTSGTGTISATALNGTALSGLATGIVKNTTVTGVPSIAIAADFPTLNQNTSGTAANLSGTPALPNGTTSTTQAAASNDTKLATDAYVDGHFIANGTFVLGTTAIASGACATVVTVVSASVLATDVLTTGFNGDPTAVTGYGASATGAVLTIYPYPTAGNANVKVCNSSASSITPSALTLNWKVTR